MGDGGGNVAALPPTSMLWHLGKWGWVSGTPSVCFNPAPACPQLLEVNKQWDQHFRSMKQQYEQKVMEFLGAEPRMAQGGGMRGFYPD